MRRLRWVVVGAVVLMLVVVGVLWELHLREKLKGGVILVHSGRPSNGKPPTYMYVPNGGVIRVEGDDDKVGAGSSPPATSHPASLLPHHQQSHEEGGLSDEAAVYVRSILTNIPAPPLITSDSTLVDIVRKVVDGVSKLLPSPPSANGENRPEAGRDDVFPIVLHVAGTGLSLTGHYAVTLGQVWGRMDGGGSRVWHAHRSESHPRLPLTLQNGTSPSSKAGWYCVSISITGSNGLSGGIKQVLTTSFVLTDPTNKHNPSEFGVTPTTLQLFPHLRLPITQAQSILVMRASGVITDVAYPSAYFPTSLTTTSSSTPPRILQTLLQVARSRKGGRPDEDDAPSLFVYPEGEGLLAAHRQATRMCVPHTKDIRLSKDDEEGCVPIVNKMGSYLSNGPPLRGGAYPTVGGITLRRELVGSEDDVQIYDHNAVTSVSTFKELKAWMEAASQQSSVMRIDATIMVPANEILSVGGDRRVTLLFCPECSLIVAGMLSTRPSKDSQPPSPSRSVIAQLSLLAQNVKEGWGGLVVEAGGRADLYDAIISGTGSRRVKRMKGTGTHIKRPPAITVAPSPSRHGIALSDIKGPTPLHAPQLSLTRCALTDLHGPGLGLGRGSTAVLEGVIVQAAAQGLECVECTISVSGSAFLDIPHTNYIYSTFKDEDNDGLYFRGGHAEVVGCVVANAADDGIDSASNKNDPKPSSLTIKNTLISNAQHEGIALSGSVGAHRTVLIEDVVIEGCQQGVENGHSSDTHHAILRRVLLLGNQIGVRHGDDYKLAVDGRLEGEEVLFMGMAAPPHITVPGTGNTVPYADIVLSEMRKHEGEVHHGGSSHTKWLGPNAFHYRRDHALFNCSNCAILTAPTLPIPMPSLPSAASGPLLAPDGNVCGERIVNWSVHD